MSQNCTNGGICQQARVLQAEQEINEAIQIANSGLVWVGDKKKPVIEVALVPGELSDASKLGLSWNCTNFTNTFMDFQVYFQHTEQISINDYKEKVKIDFHGKKYFTSEDGQMFNNEDAFAQRTIP